MTKTEKILREWVEYTIFIDSQTRKKLLDMEKWDQDILDIIKTMFKKYIKKEWKILEKISQLTNQAYLETIQEIESEQREKELTELNELEKMLETA